MENPRDLLQFFSSAKLPLTLQTEGAECGLASLAMVAGYYGYHATLTELRQQFSISLKGANLIELMEIAAQLKLIGRPVKVDMDSLGKLTTPTVLHWDMMHFVVLKKITRKYIEIHDPAVGIRRLSHEEFSTHFTGVALELIPAEDFEQKSAEKKLTLSDFWQRISGLRSTLFKVFILSLLLQLFALVSPYYMRLVMDDVIISNDLHLLAVLALGFGLVMLIETVTQMMRSLVILHLGNQLGIQMAANLFYHLVRLPLSYFEKRHIGDIVSRFGSLQQVKETLTTGIVEALIDGLMALTTGIMLFIYSPLLALIVFCSVLIYTAVRLLLFRPLRRSSEEAIMTQAQQQSNFMETVRGMQSIKLFGREVQRQGLWQNRYADALNANIKVSNLTIGYGAINQFLFGLENVLVIFVAATLVLNGEFSVGMLFAFIAYKVQFTGRMSNLIEKLLQFKMLALHFDRLADIIKTKKEADLIGSATMKPGDETLELNDITFRYSDGEAPIISQLNFSAAPGESVAIVGPSGCGKSTLMKVMLGLFEPEQGCVRFGGSDIRTIGLSSYRSQVAAVMQDDQLLSGTIGENIAFFELEFELEKVQNSARLASIHDDIMKMAMGYNTLIGDMGAALSGGQKQRLILARALYREPKILFMDEATSHLDTTLESLVSSAVRELNITRIIIAHRPETIATADRIVALKHGQLKSVG